MDSFFMPLRQHTNQVPWFVKALFYITVPAVLIFIHGCAKPYGAVTQQHNEAPVCCNTLAELPVEPIRPGDKKSFDMGAGSNAYRFDTGKSYFRAFALPQGPYPYKVTVRSYLVGDDLRSAYFFFPRLITLDENRKVVRSTGEETFSLQWADYLETMRETAGLRHKLEGGLVFPDGSLGERYLVILTTDDFVQTKTPVTAVGNVPILTPGYSVTVPGDGNEVPVAHAPAGRVNVSLTPLVAEMRSVANAATSTSGSDNVPPSLPRSEVVTVRLAGGKAAGKLELGRTTVDSARVLFESAGGGMGTERQNSATFSIGTQALTPTSLFTPPGTPHQLYFDAEGTLVLFVDGTPADLPRTGNAFRQQFSGFRETGRNQFSYELEVPLSTCVTLIAHFGSGSDTLEFAAYVYVCRVEQLPGAGLTR